MVKALSSTPHEKMERYAVMMTTEQRARGEALAQQAGVSFGEIVRRALAAYAPAPDEEHSVALEMMAESLIRSTDVTLARLDALERRLDETHAQLAEHRYGVE